VERAPSPAAFGVVVGIALGVVLLLVSLLPFAWPAALAMLPENTMFIRDRRTPKM